MIDLDGEIRAKEGVLCGFKLLLGPESDVLWSRGRQSGGLTPRNIAGGDTEDLSGRNQCLSKTGHPVSLGRQSLHLLGREES
jgi:hypothetical protein